MERADQQQWLKSICQRQGITVSDAAAERIGTASDTVADAVAQVSSHSLFDTEPVALANVLAELAADEPADE